MNGDNQINQFPITDKMPSRGPVFGTVIIILLIILGGIYILASRSSKPKPTDNTTTTTESPAGRDGTFQTTPEPATQTPDLSDLDAEAQMLELDLQTLETETNQ